MNFLSEVALDYPKAISFASGRPTDAFFDLEAWFGAAARFGDYVAARTASSPAAVGKLLAQYGRTNGLINDLVSQQLAKDDGVVCPADRLIITAGCQEAMALCLQALCARPGDVVLARNPTYIGITGAADFAGIPIVPLADDGTANLVIAFREAIAALRADGKNPRVLYLIPEFDNPTGTVLSKQDRAGLIEVAAEFQIVILEDNPYGMFRFDGDKEPPMYALDGYGLVIYLGTYSKTLCPAVRVGCAALPETLFGDKAASAALANEIGERKSYLTVNTSQLTQAIVAGILLEQQCTLSALTTPALQFYRRNRDVLAESLATAFGNRGGTVWTRPDGGFFLSLTLPFAFRRDEMIVCAKDHGVIVMPMSFFALDDSQENVVRVSFSNVSPDAIRAGVERFAAYVNDRVA